MPQPQSVAVEVTPLVTSLAPGGSATFEAVVTGTADTRVSWAVEGNAGGSVTPEGIYTAPAQVGTYRVVATSVADTTKSASATVSVSTVPTVVVAVSPRSVTLTPGGARDFTCSVAGNANTACTWIIREAGGGSVNTTASAVGHYVAPARAGTYTLVATSVADTTKSDVATITVSGTPVVSVALSPESATLPVGGTLDFTCSVTGTTSTACNWTVREAGGGSVTTTASTIGHYVAPAQAGTYTLVATSVADATKSDTAIVTVTKDGQPSTLKESLARLAARKIFFGHNSIGRQILDGVNNLAAANGVSVPIRSRDDLSGYDGISEDWVGTNGDPQSKVNDFSGRLMRDYGSKAKYALMKLCFVDFPSAYTAEQIFAWYKAGVAEVKAAYPNVTLVHVTAPLCNGVEARSNSQGASSRNRFNQLLRSEYQGKAPLFDLALSEATDASAGGVQVEGGVQILAARWSQSDNCHLSPAGQEHLALDFVQYLASLP